MEIEQNLKTIHGVTRYMRQTKSQSTFGRTRWLLATMAFVFVFGHIHSWSQELPTFGKNLWTLNLDTLYVRGAIDCAADANLLFVGTKKGWLLAIDSEKGVVVDSFNVRSLSRYRDLSGKLDVYSVRCSQDGRTVAVGVTSTRVTSDLTCDIFVLQYPSWRVVDTLLFSLSGPSRDPYGDCQFGISPSGRYLALPDSSWKPMTTDSSLKRLRVLDRSTGRYRVVPWSTESRLDFDGIESTIAYCEMVNTSRGYYMNYVRTLSLTDEQSTPQGWDVYGIPYLSADGSKLMVAGYGRHFDKQELDLLPHATVYDIATRDTIWHLKSDRSGVGLDLISASWSKDGKHILTYRDSRNLVPREWHGTVLYRVGESKPIAKLDTNVWFSYRAFGEDRAGVSHPNLTGGYFARYNIVHATDYSLGTTGTDEIKPKVPDVIYPNPTSGSVTVSCSSASPAVSWGVFTLTGNMVAKGMLGDSFKNPYGDATFLVQLPESLPISRLLLTLQDRTGKSVCTYQMVMK